MVLIATFMAPKNIYILIYDICLLLMLLIDYTGRWRKSEYRGNFFPDVCITKQILNAKEQFSIDNKCVIFDP